MVVLPWWTCGSKLRRTLPSVMHPRCGHICSTIWPIIIASSRQPSMHHDQPSVITPRPQPYVLFVPFSRPATRLFNAAHPPRPPRPSREFVVLPCDALVLRGRAHSVCTICSAYPASYTLCDTQFVDHGHSNGSPANRVRPTFPCSIAIVPGGGLWVLDIRTGWRAREG